MAVMTATPTIVYYIYCNRQYKEIVKFRIVRDGEMYKRVFSFSAWVSVGSVAHIAKNQGAALVINAFFDTVMNTAMGVANSICYYVSLLANGAIQPMQPQITKSYAAGDSKRTDELLIMSTKYSFLLTLLVGSIFLVVPDWLLSLWLGSVPAYASIFLVLLVIDQMVQSFNAGINNIIWASGKIALYQILTSALNLLAIVAGYFVLRYGAPAYYLLVAYIVVSVMMFFVIQFSLKKTLHYNSRSLWKYSYVPSFFTLVLFIPILLIPNFNLTFIKVMVVFLYLCVIEWFVGLSKVERGKIAGVIKNKIRK